MIKKKGSRDIDKWFAMIPNRGGINMIPALADADAMPNTAWDRF